MRKKIILIFSMILLIGSIFQINFVESLEPSYCCERTTEGMWCQNAPENLCEEIFRKAPTSCDATSYCRMGTCIDAVEGTCSKNVPQQVCEQNGGTWQSGTPDEIPQCQLGCCVLGYKQAAFVSLTRCKRLSALYGLETNYNSGIENEIQCISSIGSSVKGACVYKESEQEMDNSCKFITQKECNKISDGEFYADTLCSDESLGTICGPSEKTTCVEGTDEVYFVDTCGNIANIYDASRIDDPIYWSDVFEKEESCNSNSGNANSASCGNCDYLLGSSCGSYRRGEDRNPSYGDYICRDLGCEYEGKEYKHGESWCADAPSTSEIFFGEEIVDYDLSMDKNENLPGTRYHRMLCYNGEVTVEPCADFRQEICIQDEVNDFKNAACVVNKWQDCFNQDNRKDCENIDKRDCVWVEGQEFLEGIGTRQRGEAFSGGETERQPFAGTGNAIIPGQATSLDQDSKDKDGVCVPKYKPGFNFWESGDAEDICSLANKQCEVTYKKAVFGDWECEDNCECLEDAWALEQNEFCIALGDCGNKDNYLGYESYGEGFDVSIARFR